MNFHAMTRNELEQALVGPHAEGAEGVLVLDYHWKCLRLAPGQLLHNENCAPYRAWLAGDKEEHGE